MQVVVEIKNKSLAGKIIKLLEIFKNDGVEIKEISEAQQWNDEYIKKNWKELGMNTHSAHLDDDERLYDAAWGFYNEKYSN